MTKVPDFNLESRSASLFAKLPIDLGALFHNQRALKDANILCGLNSFNGEAASVLVFRTTGHKGVSNYFMKTHRVDTAAKCCSPLPPTIHTLDSLAWNSLSSGSFHFSAPRACRATPPV